MERDERGREVRQVPPPGHREPELDDSAWPDLEHSPYTFEGRIEQMGVVARGINRGGRHSPAFRIAVWIVVIAMLTPIVLFTAQMVMDAFEGCPPNVCVVLRPPSGHDTTQT